MKKLSALLLGFLLFFSPCAVKAENDPVGEIQALADGILSSFAGDCDKESVQQWIDKTLSAQAGSGAEWYLIALRQSGVDYDFSSYTASLRAYLSSVSAETLPAATRQKYALALLASGGATADEFTPLLDETLGKQGIMSLIFALHLYQNHCQGSVSKEEVIADLLSLQLEDGGWALYGRISDVDVTAMTLQALAPDSENVAVKEAIDSAVNCLSARQNPDGGYSGFGNANAESTAQVLLALSACGIDAVSDARFFKNGFSPLDALQTYRLPDGTFCHTAGGKSSDTATSQALEALIGMLRFMRGEKPFYLFDGSPTQNTSVPESAAEPISTVLSTPSVISGSSVAPSGHPVSNLKLFLCLGILLLAALTCAVLFFRGRRKAKFFLPVILSAIVLCAAVWIINLQSAEDYYGAGVSKQATGSVTVSIDATRALGQTDVSLPESGMLLEPTVWPIAAGDTVYDVLMEISRRYTILLDVRGTAQLPYVAGISSLQEYALGPLSGWMYQVNGVLPSTGCASYVLQDGDTLVWCYSRSIGNDLS